MSVMICHDGSSIPASHWSASKYVNIKMRSIIVEWLLRLIESFEYKYRLFVLAVWIFDQFMAFTGIDFNKSKLALIAISALAIAANIYQQYIGLYDVFNTLNAASSESRYELSEVKNMIVYIPNVLKYQLICDNFMDHLPKPINIYIVHLILNNSINISLSCKGKVRLYHDIQENPKHQESLIQSNMIDIMAKRKAKNTISKD